MGEYSDLINSYVNAAPTVAATSVDDDPQKAARAIELSGSTGVPAPAIYGDVDGFEAQHKAGLAADIVRNNQQLTAYVNSHPLASTVSNDDWGNLDKFSQAAQGTKNFLSLLNPVTMPSPAALHVAQQEVTEAAEGFKEGYGSQPYGAWLDTPYMRTHPLAWAIASAGWFPFEAAARVVGGLTQGAVGAARGGARAGYQEVTGDQAGAEQFSRDIAGMTEYELNFGQGMAHVPEMEAARPWLEHGIEPPRGVHPAIDAAKADLNAHALSQLEIDLANAQESVTKTRSPELFQNFVQQHYGDLTIGIHGDAVAGLYGGREPAPGDGLLGFVPGIQDQIALARDTGADVHIPVADWISQVDPAIAQGLHDDIRMWPGGITAREATEPVEPKLMVDSPLASVRGTSGLEPMFAMGDRKISLEGKPPYEGFEEFHTYDMLDENGKSVGEIEILPDPEKKQLYVMNVMGSGGMWANSFGPSLIRDLKRQLRDLYPGFETITGHRVTGAREEAGVTGEPIAHPVVKLNWNEVDTASDFQDFKRILDSSWRDVGGGVNVRLQPKEMWQDHQVEISNAVADELKKSAPRVNVVPTHGLFYTPTGIQPLGMYLHDHDLPTILYDLSRPDSIGTARHEAIHYLKNSGFFSQDEWGILSDAALREGWLDRYGIREKYPNLGTNQQIEESIAEGYREWAQASEEGRAADGPVGRVFQKLKDFLDRIRQRIDEIFGGEPSYEQLFQRTQSGEIGRRGQGSNQGFREPFFQVENERQPLIVSRKMPDGTIRYGKPGQIHADLISEDELNHRPFFPPAPESMGFSTGEGAPFMTRGEATRYLDDNFPDISKGVTGVRLGNNREIEAAQLNRAVDKSNEIRADNLRASAVGLDINSYRKLQEQINARYQDDIAAAQKRAERLQTKRQSAEWQANREELRSRVEETIRQRPDVAADLFVGSGELYGEKLRQRYPLRADDLTDEQKAALPRHYYANNGLPVDQVAHLFGYGSGDAMVQRMAEYNAMKEGKTPQEMFRSVVDQETDRQMEARYGQLDQNIMDEAKDQALSETNLNLLAEEMYAAGLKAGQPVIDKDVAKSWAQEQFGKMTLANVNSDRLMSQMAKHGRDAERALIAGDPATALVSMQKKYMSAVLASEARKLEKERIQFDKQAKTFSARSLPSMEPEYLNWIHDIMIRVGKPVRRSIQDLQEQIGATTNDTLEKFVAEKEGALRELPVAEFLTDSSWRKDYNSLSVSEFRAVRDSIKALAFNGRDELKITKAGEAADLAAVKGDMIGLLQRFSEKHYDVEGKRAMGPVPAPVAGVLRTYAASHMQIENVLNRWDKFDPQGPWNQYVMRDLIEGANQEDAWKKEYSQKLRDTADDVDLSKTVDNTLFRDPSGGTLFQFNRANLRAVLLNAGNRSNLDKLSRGYGLAPDAVMAWLNQHATKEDWDWAQKVWDMFADIKVKADTMYRNLTGGVAPEGIPISPVETPHGTYKGGYYPVIYHPEFEGASKRLMGRDPLEQENYVRATTPAGYTKGRTGYAAPMALNLDALPNRISQMLHDIALRPAVLNASKVFYDKDIRSAIARHYGTEYRDQLVPYLRDVANASNYMAKDQALFSRAGEFIRQNLITTLVGLNPGTVMKHGPTAMVLSMKEVGLADYLKATKSLLSINEDTGENQWQFAMRNSLELQRRDRNWGETLYGATNALDPNAKFSPLRAKIMELSSKPVAISDMLSAVPTWLARYQRSIEEGGTHGDAVYDADRAVRRAHGSTAVTNRPSIMRNSNPWLTSVYNFFNDVMNRQAELVWRAGDALGEVKSGDYDKAMAAVPAIAGGLFAYIVWPAVVENLVSGEPDKKPEPWAEKAGKVMLQSLSSSWVGVRDFANALIGGYEPSFGLTQSGMKEVLQLGRDFGKNQPLNKAHAGRVMQDAAGMTGLFTGMVPQQVGRSARFAYDVSTGQEHPRGPWGWMSGLRFGTLKGHSSTFENYLKGRPY